LTRSAPQNTHSKFKRGSNFNRATKFVKQKDLPAVRKQLKNYARMKLLTDRWIDLATELSTLRLNKDAN
jgi:hypothetical protein